MTDSKRLVELAEKELKENKERKQVELIKFAVWQTLEKIEKKTNEKKELEKEIKILKLDIDNIKAGKLELIEERQKKDERVKNTSVVIIEREKIIEKSSSLSSPWYEPYKIYPIWVDSTDCYPSVDWATETINCSVAKSASSGTYKLNNGTIKSIS